VNGEVAPAQVRRRDVRDERLVGRSVEALAGAEQTGGDGEGGEGRGRVEPRTGAVDEQPRDRPEQWHQRQRTHTTTAFDHERQRQLHDHDHGCVDGEDQTDLALADMRVVPRELR